MDQGHPEMFDGPSSDKATKREAKKAAKAERQFARSPKPIVARNAAQKTYIRSLVNNELTFGVGPAGVGKTYVPSRIYGEMLAQKKIEKLYIARPNVAKSRHKMGFLPGTAEEKTAPWLIPILEGIRDSMSKSQFEAFRREKLIEEVPYEFIQGRTMKNAAWIVDEAENLDADDLYITLTRQGEDLKMVLCGDINQSRIPNSGFAEAVAMAEQPHMEGIGVVRFQAGDIVRSRQARQWAQAYENRQTLYSSPEHGMDQDVQPELPLFITRDP